MDFNKLSDSECARILREYQRHHDNQEINRENSKNVAGMLAGVLVIFGGICAWSFPGKFGQYVGTGCLGLAVFLAILSWIGSSVSRFNDHHHNPLD